MSASAYEYRIMFVIVWLKKNINLHLWGHFSGHKPFFKGAFPTVEEYALFTLEWQHGIDPSVS